MGSELGHLTGYYVVDCDDRPIMLCPMKHRHNADAKCAQLNGPSTDGVRGVPNRRPYRVVVMVARELRDPSPEGGHGG